MIPQTLLPVTKSLYRALGGGSLPEKRTYACRKDTMERIFAETIVLHVLLYALMLGNRNMYEAALPYRRHSRHETHGKGVSFFLFPLPVF